MPQRDTYLIREIGGAGCFFSVVLNGQLADEYIVATMDETATMHGLPDRDLTDDDVFEFEGEKFVIIFNPDDSEKEYRFILRPDGGTVTFYPHCECANATSLLKGKNKTVRINVIQELMKANHTVKVFIRTGVTTGQWVEWIPLN